MNRKYYESIDLLKVLLLVLIIISSYTLINTTGIPFLSMLNFCVGAFYVQFGYFVLREGDDLNERLKKSIQHTAIAFVVAAVVYFALVCAIELFAGGRIADLFTKRSIFEFVVLNGWEPSVGGNIWIISSALYALIIFYFFNKLNLLRYDKYIMIALFVITVLVGEFAGLYGFRVLGYTYIPGCFLARAMPYMLLGRILYKARSRKYFRKIKNWMWAVLFFVGLALTFIEMIGLVNSHRLVYLNHMIGFIPMSVAAVMFFLNLKSKLKYGKYYRDIGYAGFYLYSVVARFIYMAIASRFGSTNGILYALLGVFTLVVTLILGIIYARIRNGKLPKPEEKPAEDQPAEEQPEEELPGDEGENDETSV